MIILCSKAFYNGKLFKAEVDEKEPFEYFCILDEYPDYEISNMGYVRKKQSARIILSEIVHNGYARLKLKNKDGEWKKVRRSTLVASAFCDLPDGVNINDLEVDHINRQRLDDRANNLRWVTHQENIMNRANVIANDLLKEYYLYYITRQQLLDMSKDAGNDVLEIVKKKINKICTKPLTNKK